MKYLGIDYGEKRVGLATSEESGLLAFPHSVLENGGNLISDLKEIIKKEEIGKIILGESKNFKGEDNKIMEGIRDFKQKLESETSLEIIFEPEFLTSHQAQKTQPKTDLLDASAASIILQSYLDRINNSK